METADVPQADRKTRYKTIHVMGCEDRKEGITLISIQPGEGLMYA